jgi:hypothetical protein
VISPYGWFPPTHDILGSNQFENHKGGPHITFENHASKYSLLTQNHTQRHCKIGQTTKKIMISNIEIKHIVHNMVYTLDKVQNLRQFRGHLVNPFIKNGQYSHKTRFIGDNMEIQHVFTMH